MTAIDDNLQYARAWCAAGLRANGFHIYGGHITALVDTGDIAALVVAQKIIDDPRVSHLEHETEGLVTWIVAVAGRYRDVYASAQGAFADPEPVLAALAGETDRGATDGEVQR